MHAGYTVRLHSAIPDLLEGAPGRLEVYAAWGVDSRGTCLCPKRERCPHPGKHPMGRHGINDATSDPLELAGTFASCLGCNVGLATGVRSGVAALDNDSLDGAASSLKALQEEHGPLPPTTLHQTGSGDLRHFFALPEGLERLPSKRIAPGVELKADGTGVLLPPSRTNWGAYEVLIEGPLAMLPGWIADRATSLTVHEGGGDETTRSRYRLPETIREGTRALTLYRYGCSLRAHGWAHDAILEELRRVSREVCDQPPVAGHGVSDAEVRKIARSAARHERGNTTTATPEALEALEGIEAAIMAGTWPGVGGKSERSVMIALVGAAREHGTLIPAGVRTSLDYRSLGLASGLGKSSANRAAHRLRLKGWLRFDNHGREAEHSGAFVLLTPASPTPRTPGHSATPPPPSEGGGGARATGSVNVPLRAPRLRWGFSLGKGDEAVLDALEMAGGEMGLAELAEAVGTRPRDLRRRSVARLEAAGVVEVVQTEAGEVVRLRDNWLEALEEERMRTGEKRAENLDRAEYERQREAFREHLAERKETQ